jgi:CheY-like chemotaxis protein
MARILWIDDEDDIREVTRTVLESVGYEVESLRTAEEAIAKIEQDPFAYDLVLTDVSLEGSSFDGEQLMHRIFEIRDKRGYDPAPHVICMTGKPERQKSQTIRRVEENGGRVVMKGHPNGYLPYIAAELDRITMIREKGPTFIIVHSISNHAGDSLLRAGDICEPGEAVTKVLLSRLGDDLDLMLNPGDRLLFDFLCRTTQRYAKTLTEITQAFSQHRFYEIWQDDGVTSSGVKQSIYRIRARLREVFDGAQLNIDPNAVLVTEKIAHDDRKRTQYMVKGRFIVRHQP